MGRLSSAACRAGNAIETTIVRTRDHSGPPDKEFRVNDSPAGKELIDRRGLDRDDLLRAVALLDGVRKGEGVLTSAVRMQAGTAVNVLLGGDPNQRGALVGIVREMFGEDIQTQRGVAALQRRLGVEETQTVSAQGTPERTSKVPVIGHETAYQILVRMGGMVRAVDPCGAVAPEVPRSRPARG
jgi:hypothetical protein